MRPDGAPLLHLPVVYAVALALRDAGVPATEIAERLDLSPASIPTLFEIAEAKLASLRLAVGTDETRTANLGPGSVADPRGSRTD